MKDPESLVFGMSTRFIMKLVLVLCGAMVLSALFCNVPSAIDAVTPDATPRPDPTFTPVPTWTPIPPLTATPRPLSDLPNQQRHYDEYRLYHFISEYDLCYRGSVTAPAPAPVITGTAEPGEAKPPEPTPTPQTLALDDVSLAFHSPPPHGVSDLELEAHVTRDLAGATRWLIERYREGGCLEPRQFAVFPGRLIWLNRYQ